MNCNFHIYLFSASSFSSQYLLLFLKSSRSCVLLLPNLFKSVSVRQWHHKEGNFFLRIWTIQLNFLWRYYLEVYSFLLYVQELLRRHRQLSIFVELNLKYLLIWGYGNHNLNVIYTSLFTQSLIIFYNIQISDCVEGKINVYIQNFKIKRHSPDIKGGL